MAAEQSGFHDSDGGGGEDDEDKEYERQREKFQIKITKPNFINCSETKKS